MEKWSLELSQKRPNYDAIHQVIGDLDKSKITLVRSLYDSFGEIWLQLLTADGVEIQKLINDLPEDEKEILKLLWSSQPHFYLYITKYPFQERDIVTLHNTYIALDEFNDSITSKEYKTKFEDAFKKQMKRIRETISNFRKYLQEERYKILNEEAKKIIENEKVYEKTLKELVQERKMGYKTKYKNVLSSEEIKAQYNAEIFALKQMITDLKKFIGEIPPEYAARYRMLLVNGSMQFDVKKKSNTYDSFISEWKVIQQQLTEACYMIGYEKEKWDNLYVLGQESKFFEEIFEGYTFKYIENNGRMRDWIRIFALKLDYNPNYKHYREQILSLNLRISMWYELVEDILEHQKKYDVEKIRELQTIMLNRKNWTQAINRHLGGDVRIFKVKCCICNEIPKYICGSCEQEYFCGKKCQKIAWETLEHKCH